MIDFQARSLGRRILYSRPAVVVLLIIVIAAARPVWKISGKSRAVVEERARVVAQVAELEERKAFLEKKIASLQTERGMEGEIREKFPVVKEGEKVIIVGDDIATSAPVAATSTGWWKNLFK